MLFVKENAHRNSPPVTEFVDIDWVFVWGVQTNFQLKAATLALLDRISILVLLKYKFLSSNRECIHPWIPKLAIIGFSESISSLHNSEMRCWWLAGLLDGTFKLPGTKEMEKDIAKGDKFMKRYSRSQYYRRSCIGALHIWYDQLRKYMGWKPKRKKGFIAELFEPYIPLGLCSTLNLKLG